VIRRRDAGRARHGRAGGPRPWRPLCRRPLGRSAGAWAL